MRRESFTALTGEKGRGMDSYGKEPRQDAMSASILAVRAASGSEAGFLPAVVATLPMCKDQLLLLCLLQLSQFSWAYLYSKELLL